MRKIMMVTLLFFCCLLIGCDSFRFAPTEKQKQNAWLHNRTSAAAVRRAESENASEKLQALTQLSQLQSREFTAYYGMPKQIPDAETDEQILSEAGFQLSCEALADAGRRPDAWQIADAGMELAIGIAALFGGVYGTKTVRFLKQAKAKSEALQEIIEGNELFKKQNSEVSQAFKTAHKDQSPQTRQIVAELKS